ncbi:MAG: hypothetical protein IKP92_08930 [Lachnospiraceae bacterium]|nr:hypothetical protein [Lachnospiraceae bacterium]
MDGFEAGKLVGYLNSNDYAKKNKHHSSDDDDRSLGEMIKDDIKLAIQNRIESIELEWGVWEPDQKLKTEAKRNELFMAQDATRKEIKDLPFEALPKERADGLKGGFLYMAWNAFVAEIAAGRVEVAEVLVLDYQDVSLSDDPNYYFKIADLDGMVLRGGIRKIVYNKLGMVDYNHTSPKHDDYVAYFRWEWPEDYMESHPNKTPEDYKRYEMAFMANGLTDQVLTEHRKHAYVVHYQKKGKDVYGLITKDELDNLKQLKDSITFLNATNWNKTENNTSLRFTW